jgi:hypothetical protein
MTCDTLIIGYDSGSKDESALSIVRKIGLNKLELVNLFTGEAAEEVYNNLISGSTTLKELAKG